MSFVGKSSFRHGTVARAAVLLVNLGTPDAATVPAVRRYLREFLSDHRVVEIPSFVWKPLLNGVILPLRAKSSAAKYASIWTAEGSPLRTWTAKQANLLRGWLGEHGWDVEVAWAMRYGTPSVAGVLTELQTRDVDRVLVVPMYPQYSCATTGSVLDAVFDWSRRARDIPELRIVKHHHDRPEYIDALADRLRAHWEREGRADKLVLSFHGMPRRTLELGDPYHCECRKTARLLAERLGLGTDEWLVTFQSRFGKAEWLKPYTAPTLVELAKQGVARVDVMCPGFPADCLETLEEIAIEGKQEFLAAGGRDYRYVSCLNDRPAWIDALGLICESHATHWFDRRDERDERGAAAAIGRTQAAAYGAKNLTTSN